GATNGVTTRNRSNRPARIPRRGRLGRWDSAMPEPPIRSAQAPVRAAPMQMPPNEEIDRLRRRLQWEGAGPLTDLSNQAASALLARLRAFAQWVRGAGEERPLI